MEKRVLTLLPELSHGDHCCLLFSSPEQQMQVTVPFLALGLERDEKSVFVGDADSVELLRSSFKQAGVSVDAEVGAGRLVFASNRDYLDGGRFTTDRMLSFLQQAYDETLGEGFTALR